MRARGRGSCEHADDHLGIKPTDGRLGGVIWGKFIFCNNFAIPGARNALFGALGEQFVPSVPKPRWVKTLGWQELEGRGCAARRRLAMRRCDKRTYPRPCDCSTLTPCPKQEQPPGDEGGKGPSEVAAAGTPHHVDLGAHARHLIRFITFW